MIASKGIYLTLITMALWAIDIVFTRYSLIALDANPVIFTCLSLLVAATILILIAGPGKGGLKTLNQFHTWGYGICQVLMNITQMVAVIYMTSTELSFISRISIILALVISWLFFKRKLSFIDFGGVILIMLGIINIVSGLARETIAIALVWAFLGAFFNTARTAIAEAHPASNEATTIKARCRVTGYVLLVTSFILLAITLLIANLKGYIAPDIANQIAFFNAIPSTSDFLHQPTIFSAMALGLVLLPMAMYFYFYALRVVKTDNFLIILALMPFFVYFVEYIFFVFYLSLTITGVILAEINFKPIITSFIIFLALTSVVVVCMYMFYIECFKASESWHPKENNDDDGLPFKEKPFGDFDNTSGYIYDQMVKVSNLGTTKKTPPRFMHYLVSGGGLVKHIYGT